MGKYFYKSWHLVIAIIFIYFSCLGLNQKEKTPIEFLNKTIIKYELYSKDSIEILNNMKLLLNKHKGFFCNKAYSDSTILIIDSIVYNKEFNKLAIFLITKNPTYKQLVPDDKLEWYFDATCYLAFRQDSTIILSWIGPTFTNSSSEKSASNYIRDECFNNFATKKMAIYPYNINDIRFWNCPIWEDIKKEKLKEKEFELEKLAHPENVYDPETK